MGQSAGSHQETSDLRTMEEVARSVPGFPWAVSNPYEDARDNVIQAVGPEYDEDSEWNGDFYEDTILEVCGGGYDSGSIARFVATFDPPTVLDLLRRATLRDEEIFEQVGTLDGEPIFRRRP